MTFKKMAFFFSPFVISGAAVAVAFGVRAPAPISWGILVGLTLAVVQSFVAVGLMKWTWHTKIFYWSWGGGMLLRFLVFAGTAFVVIKYTGLNLVATLISLVVGTTLFLTFESSIFLKGN